MGTISPELQSFKDSLDGKTDNMNSIASKLSSDLGILASTCSTAKSAVAANYKSANQSLVLSTFDTLSKDYTTIQTSIDGVLKPIISDSASLVDDVKKLEEINKKIAEQQEIINNNPGDDDTAVTRRYNAQSEINTKNTEFNTILVEANSKLSKLKSNSDTIELSSDAQGVTADPGDIVADGGVFKQASFTSPTNGKVVNYYIYVPNVTDTTTKIPMLVYFHGLNDTIERNNANNNKYGGGLAGLIQQDKIQPKGIVIFPQTTGGTTNRDFVSADYEKAVIELAYDVADKYNGDTNRLSVAGHSNGGAAVYHIVNNYPGVFAAAAPMSAAGRTDEGIMKTKLYAFVGSNDHVMGNPSAAIGVAKRLGQMYKVYPGEGHPIQTHVWLDDISDENGKTVHLMDWLMRQTLNS